MSNAVATLNTNAVVNISNGYNSIVGTDLDTRKRIFKAVASAVKLADNLDLPIQVVDILAQPVTGENETTGEVEDYLRITLIDVDGIAYSAGSKGLHNSVQSLIAIFGEPSTWTEPLVVTAVERKAQKGKYFALELV